MLNHAPAAGSHQQQASSTTSHIPASSYLLFDNAPNTQAVLKKLREFNQALAASDDTKELSLSKEQSASGLDHLVARYSCPS